MSKKLNDPKDPKGPKGIKRGIDLNNLRLRASTSGNSLLFAARAIIDGILLQRGCSAPGSAPLTPPLPKVEKNRTKGSTESEKGSNGDLTKSQKRRRRRKTRAKGEGLAKGEDNSKTPPSSTSIDQRNAAVEMETDEGPGSFDPASQLPAPIAQATGEQSQAALPSETAKTIGQKRKGKEGKSSKRPVKQARTEAPTETNDRRIQIRGAQYEFPSEADQVVKQLRVCGKELKKVTMTLTKFRAKVRLPPKSIIDRALLEKRTDISKENQTVGLNLLERRAFLLRSQAELQDEVLALIQNVGSGEEEQQPKAVDSQFANQEDNLLDSSLSEMADDVRTTSTGLTSLVRGLDGVKWGDTPDPSLAHGGSQSAGSDSDANSVRSEGGGTRSKRQTRSKGRGKTSSVSRFEPP